MKLSFSDNALLAAMPAGVRAMIEPELELRPFGHGFPFYEPEAAIERVWFPLDGVISIVTVMADGSSVETATVGREGAIGLGSVIAPIRAHGRTIGQAPGQTVSLPSEMLRRLAIESAPLRELAMRYYEVVLAQAQQSVACNTLHDVEERLCRWILTCDDRVRGGRVELTQEFLAMMLGVQRTTVSQVASGLQAAGLIRYNRGRIDILDRPGLLLRACECYEVLRRRARAFLPQSADAATPTTAKESAELG